MRGLADEWEKSFEKNSFHTDHYIVLSVDKDAGRVGMEEASQLTLAALTPFKPELLTSASGESPLKILGRLASPISRPAPKFIKGASVSDQISADTVEFADDKTGDRKSTRLNSSQ